jgi:hypothetical protein
MDFSKLSKYSFFVFLFLLPFQTVYLLREPMIEGEKWQYGTIGVYGTDILLFVAIVFAVIASVAKQSRGKNGEWRMANGENKSQGWIFPGLPRRGLLAMTEWSLALLILWAGLSIFWAVDQVLALYFFVKLLLVAGAFFFARSFDEGGAGTAVKILLAAAVIQSILGVGQFVTQSTFSSSLLGMSAHESWQAGTSVLKNDDGRWLRAYGSFPHPNMLGGFLAAIFVLGISYLVSCIRNRQPPLSFFILHSSFAVLLLALVLTFSRAAWFGAIIGMLALCAFSKCYTNSRPWDHVTFFKTLIVLGVAASMFVFVLRDQVFPRFDGAAIAREGSVSERVQSLRDARTIIGEGNMLFGVGAGNFTNEVMRLEPNRPVWSVQPAHNVFALVLSELGAVGLFLFTAFLFSVFVIPLGRLWQFVCRMPASEKDLSCIIYHASFIMALLALLPSLLLDHFLWSSHFGLLLFFLLAGLAGRK